MECELADRPGTLIPVLEVLSRYSINISYMSTQQNGSGKQYFKMGLYIEAPGVVETDMMASFTAEDKAALAEETPVGRLAAPEEIAQTLVFLAGENAGYITGQVIGQNGGLVI